MTTEAMLAGRQIAESLMLDNGQAKRPVGKEYDETAQDMVTAYDDEFGFTSRCKLQSRNLQARDSEVGERTATSVRVELHLPVGTAPLTTGDEWHMTAAADTSTAVVGRVYRVVGPVEKTFLTARRYEVEAVVS